MLTVSAGCPIVRLKGLRLMALLCKHYLKQDYSTHTVNDSLKESTSVSPDHCQYFALSDPKKEEFRQCCEHGHSIECDRCEELC